MNKTKAVVVALVIAILGAGGFWVFTNQDTQTNDTVDSSVQQTEQQATGPVGVSDTVVVSEDGKSVTYVGETGKTALEILQGGAEVTTESSDFGDFVTGINGVEADSSKEYWSFYVDGEYASEGAGTYQTMDGEKIEWKLEQL